MKRFFQREKRRTPSPKATSPGSSSLERSGTSHDSNYRSGGNGTQATFADSEAPIQSEAPHFTILSQHGDEIHLDQHKLEVALKPLKTFSIALADLQIERSADDARGGFGIVHVARLAGTDGSPPKKVAVKELTCGSLPLRMAFRVAREITVWSKLNHPNVLPFTGYHLSDDLGIAYLVCPFIEEGNVRNYLLRCKSDAAKRADLVQDTVNGLKYLHSIGVCHGDLKSLNVLVTKAKRAMLCDFGLASLVYDENSIALATSTGFKGTVRWCSPQLLENHPRDFHSDIWAWACLALEIMTGDVPYHELRDMAVMNWIMRKSTPASATKSCKALPKGMIGLWDMCWNFDPLVRPNAATCAKAWPVCWNKAEWKSNFVEDSLTPAGVVNTFPSRYPTQPAANPQPMPLASPAYTSRDLVLDQPFSAATSIPEPLIPWNRLAAPPGSNASDISGHHGDHESHVSLAALFGTEADKTSLYNDSIRSVVPSIRGATPINAQTSTARYTSWTWDTVPDAGEEYSRDSLRDMSSSVSATSMVLGASIGRAPDPVAPDQQGDRFYLNRDNQDMALEPLKPFFIPPANLQIERSPGHPRGLYGIVRVAKLQSADGSPPKKVAVKELSFDLAQAPPLRIASRISREMTVWCKLNHLNVLPCTGYYFSNDLSTAYLVCPFIEEGNIKNYLLRCNPDYSLRAKMVQDTLGGLKYLHSMKVCHGDLKSFNVLVSSKKRAVLCDFGLASVMHDQPTGLTTFAEFKGSFRWCSPEVIDNNPRDFRSDIWGWACLALEIVTGDLPYDDVPHNVAVVDWIIGKYSPASATKSCKILPKGMLGLWDLCWSTDPSVRPDITTCARAWSVCWDKVEWHPSFLQGTSVQSPAVDVVLSIGPTSNTAEPQKTPIPLYTHAWRAGSASSGGFPSGVTQPTAPAGSDGRPMLDTHASPSDGPLGATSTAIATPQIGGLDQGHLDLRQGHFVPKPRPEDKLCISVDFGVAMSGVSYASSRLNEGQVQSILHWPGYGQTYRRIPTCLQYDRNGRLLAWGLDAKRNNEIVGSITCERFKLFLEPRTLRDPAIFDPRLPRLPPNKHPKDLIVDYLACLFLYAKQRITMETGLVRDLGVAEIWLTVPSSWDKIGCNILRDAAVGAGLVWSASAGDSWRARLHIIPELEAAAVHCLALTDLHKLQVSETLMICDAGGNSVDIGTYQVIDPRDLAIAEVYVDCRAKSGSAFLDLRFRELVQSLLADHPAHLDHNSLANFMHTFMESEKLDFRGEEEDDELFRFSCFNVEDPNDESVGLVNGELAIPGNLIRRDVFDPVVNEVLVQIDDQIRRRGSTIHALFLVGGFSENPYLFKRVLERFRDQIPVIARPHHADTARNRGAARYGLSVKTPVSSMVVPRAYLREAELPAEKEDERTRPAYIHKDGAGALMCINRIEYLVHKGAILPKGQMLISKYCKYSSTPYDHIFEAVLYTSQSDKVIRYTDEGSISELCRWSVDLSKLRLFQENSGAHQGAFFTEFELGLELNSTEVRWLLLQDGEEVSRVILNAF